MIKKNKVFKQLLKAKKILLSFSCFLIVFFAFIHPVNAAYFKYSDFDFDEFAKERKNYWTNACSDETREKGYKDCMEQTLSKQREYYTKLYKILASYEKKGLFINDNIIILTSFFGMNVDMFADDGSYYQAVTGSGTGYNIDANDDGVSESNADYYENETDTLKLLAKAMISYSYTCYGSTGKPTTQKNDDDTETVTCPNGGSLLLGSNECLTKIDTGYMGFWEQVMAANKVASFFGLASEQEESCSALISLDSNYIDTRFVASSGQVVAVEKYWDFLETSEYFDRKPHLSDRYATVLARYQAKLASDLTKEQKEEAADDLIAIRKRIVADIKALLENYGVDTNANYGFALATGDAYWWPVGGSELTADGTGAEFAMGPPVSTGVSSVYGPRTHPVTGERNKMHWGVDLTRGSGDTTYIIAAKDGVVTKAVNNCSVGNSSCGGGYGNYVIITHLDNSATVYAHLKEGTVRVKEGESVRRGQVIGIMGTTGTSTGVHLHFEIRINGERVDPLLYINSADPRQAGASSDIVNGDLLNFMMCFECSMKCPNDGGLNYIVHDDSQGNPTVGMGIYISAQRNKFIQRNVDWQAINYIGALVPKTLVDEIRDQTLSEMSNTVLKITSGMNLKQYQVDALIDTHWQRGNINNFVNLYTHHGGATQAFKEAFFCNGGTCNQRNETRWTLFSTGSYKTKCN